MRKYEALNLIYTQIYAVLYSPYTVKTWKIAMQKFTNQTVKGPICSNHSCILILDDVVWA